MARKYLVLASLALLSVAFIAIAIPSIFTEQQQNRPFLLIHQTWVGDAPIYLAQEKGFFNKYGVEVEILRVEGASERRALLSSGQADISLETIDMAVVDIGVGTPEVMVLQLDESLGADGIIAISEIREIKDLEGKTVGAFKSDPPYFLLRVLMKDAGISPDKVRWLDIQAEQAGAAFIAGQLDAAGTWEPWLSKAKEREGGHVLVSSKDVPGVIVDVMVVRKDVLENRREGIKGVMKAWIDAVEYWKENPEESNAIMAKHFDLNQEEFEEFISGLEWNDLQENLQFFGTEKNKGPIFETTKKINEIAVEDGMIEEPLDVESVIDLSLINELR